MPRPRLSARRRPRHRSPFILGADISWVQEQEDQGTRFSDQGQQKDILTILKDNGFNWIRLRVFVNPQAPKGYSNRGYCDLDHTLKMVQRVTAAGMGFLLDFHYSDTWADPGHQVKPAAWADLHGAELAKAVHVTVTLDPPTMPLNNDGDEVLMIDPAGVVRFRMEYTGQQVQIGMWVMGD